MSLVDADAMARGLKETFPTSQSVVDVGAGSGGFAAGMRRAGVRILACERSWAGRLIARCQGVRSVPFELNQNPPARLAPPFDMAYSFEVAEHLPPHLGDKLVEFISALAPVVVFTAAHPGQNSLGHINCQPQSYWIERFEACGHGYDGETSSRLSCAWEKQGVQAPWLIQNVMVFHRRAPHA
jgi:hypothetical protein